jgi:hypothetical protein
MLFDSSLRQWGRQYGRSRLHMIVKAESELGMIEKKNARLPSLKKEPYFPDGGRKNGR